jgi:hypothetical protein
MISARPLDAISAGLMKLKLYQKIDNSYVLRDSNIVCK